MTSEPTEAFVWAWLPGASDTGDLGLLTYLLESGSDRIGALDFQASATAYEARTSEATLDEMVTAADRLEVGRPLPPALETALLHADPQPVRSPGRGLR
jgi:serine/threonine-protein kinase HipA